MSIFDSVTALRVGQKVLNEFKKEMKSVVFTYENFEELQNDYEGILYKLCKEAYQKGKNDLSEKEFNTWLNHVTAYEEKANEEKQI